MTGLSQHPEYRPSGVDWLGDIPAHWEMVKLKNGFELQKRPAIKSAGIVTAFRDGQVTLRSNRRIDGYTEGDKQIGYQTIHPGDLVIHAMDAFAGAIGVSDSLGQSTPVYSACTPKSGYNAHFYARALRHIALTGYISSLAKGVRERSTDFRWADAKELPIPRPPIGEQENIVAFLDRETTQIDNLIVKQDQLIELLAEKRKAIITRAVTKGLNSTAPTKPSGVPWLGDIPAHWDCKQIKWLTQVRRGASPRPIDNPDYFDEDGEWSWVRIADVSASDGTLASTTQRLSNLGSSLSVKLNPGSLFVSIAGTVGKPCINQIKACIHDGFVYFPTLRINPQYLFRIFEAGRCYEGLGKMGTQLNLNTDTIGSIHVPVPPASEIEEILAALSTQLHKIDALSAKIIQFREKLIERRAALISAAVTGKINVEDRGVSV